MTNIILFILFTRDTIWKCISSPGFRSDFPGNFSYLSGGAMDSARLERVEVIKGKSGFLIGGVGGTSAVHSIKYHRNALIIDINYARYCLFGAEPDDTTTMEWR